MTPPEHLHTLQCTEQNCRLPVGRIIDGKLRIMAKHHGEKHYVEFSVVDLIALIAANCETKALTKGVETAIPRR